MTSAQDVGRDEACLRKSPMTFFFVFKKRIFSEPTKTSGETEWAKGVTAERSGRRTGGETVARRGGAGHGGTVGGGDGAHQRRTTSMGQDVGVE